MKITQKLGYSSSGVLGKPILAPQLAWDNKVMQLLLSNVSIVVGKQTQCITYYTWGIAD